MVIIGDKIAFSVVEHSRQLIAKAVGEGSFAIDATAGNGRDTLFLASLVGETGKVFSFDIQEESIKNTKALIEFHGMEKRVHLIHKGHEGIDDYVGVKVQGVIFNLGYLPGGDQTIATAPETTVCALRKSTQLLDQGGVLAVAVYLGHAGGIDEKEAVEKWVKELSPEEWDVVKITFPNRKTAPFVIGVQKKKWEETK